MMTLEKAICILDPYLMVDTLAEIQSNGGVDGDFKRLMALGDACKVAVAAMRYLQDHDIALE